MTACLSRSGWQSADLCIGEYVASMFTMIAANVLSTQVVGTVNCKSIEIQKGLGKPISTNQGGQNVKLHSTTFGHGPKRSRQTVQVHSDHEYPPTLPNQQRPIQTKAIRKQTIGTDNKDACHCNKCTWCSAEKPLQQPPRGPWPWLRSSEARSPPRSMPVQTKKNGTHAECWSLEGYEATQELFSWRRYDIGESRVLILESGLRKGTERTDLVLGRVRSTVVFPYNKCGYKKSIVLLLMSRVWPENWSLLMAAGARFQRSGGWSSLVSMKLC